MWISCDAIRCRNNADVDLAALRDQLGPDYRMVLGAEIGDGAVRLDHTVRLAKAAFEHP